MNKDIIFYVAASALAIGVGVFVIWGPSTSHRRRRVPIFGLRNLGFTCFLNSLLQALASCPIFIDWLEINRYDSISRSLGNVLRLLSSEAESVNGEDAISPTDIMFVLRQNGWSISPGEQDAHELFHHLILTLEEEAQRRLRTFSYGCLSDALLPPEPLPPNIMTVSKSLPTAFMKRKNERSSDVVDSQSISTDTEKLNGSVVDAALTDESGFGDLVSTSSTVSHNFTRNRKPSPFTGFLTSQTVCTKCGHKSVLRYDKFDSLSLYLPPLETGVIQHSLTNLLERFVTTEVVYGVSCDGCNKATSTEGGSTIKSTALKSLSIGKLPRCLCIHIPRTLIHDNGKPYKRQDYVDFPEYLIMDPYTQNNIFKDIRLRKQSTAAAAAQHIVSNGVGDGKQQLNSDSNIRQSNHMYRIKAVVVHRGALQGGHFVTYRRGPLRTHNRHRSNQTHGESERRWYLTSDADVRDASLSEALNSLAYMLFYEKCAKDCEFNSHIAFSSPKILLQPR